MPGGPKIFTRALVIALVLTAGALALPFINESQAVPRDCGETTLDGTIVRKQDGTLECGPGEGITVREDLAQTGAGRDQRRKPFKAFFTIADLQLADEESPARGEWADACGEGPGKSAFRPHEAFVPHLINAHVRAANRIATGGSPVLQHPFDFAVALGDLVDNQQYNETRWMIDLFDGGKLVNPDSGVAGPFGSGDGYNGVQGQDPAGGNPPLQKPANAPTAPGSSAVPLLNLANEPFWATGLREPPGSHLRWYAVMGNHDMKIQGTVPDDDPVWRAFIRAYAVGSTKVVGVPQGSQGEACAGFTDPNYWMNVLPTVGNTTAVPADPNRRIIDRQEWIDEHAVTTGIPEGHGFLPENTRCPAQPATPTIPASVLRRACYEWIEEPFHFITLDISATEGLENGNLDPVQFAWLEEKLKRSSTNYFDAQGREVTNAEGKDRLIVIFAQHPLGSMVNPGYPWNEQMGHPPHVEGGVKLGDDLRKLLLRFPNVILHADGHTHENKIWGHKDEEKGTSYWEVNTSAIADFPTHSRTIEIADNLDGTISIFAVDLRCCSRSEREGRKRHRLGRRRSHADRGGHSRSAADQRGLAGVSRQRDPLQRPPARLCEDRNRSRSKRRTTPWGSLPSPNRREAGSACSYRRSTLPRGSRSNYPSFTRRVADAGCSHPEDRRQFFEVLMGRAEIPRS